MFFGIRDDKEIVGLSDIQSDAEAISRFIKERITPFPDFILTPERENGKELLVLTVAAGRSTPSDGWDMERQGSGFKKIREAYHQAAHFREELEPGFYSDASDFYVTLYNLNYKVPIDEAGSSDAKQDVDEQETGRQEKKQAFKGLISTLKVNRPTKDNFIKVFSRFGYNMSFARSDVMEAANIT